MSDEVVREIDDAINLIDKIETFINRLSPNEKVSPGTIFQLYQSLVLLREKIVEIRVKILEHYS